MAAGSVSGSRPGVITPRLIADDVYSQLVSLIIDGHVAPEEQLSIDALAREFGVSSSPVREALARLEGTGLVRRYALRGWRVAPELSAEELGELMDARLVLEPVAAAAASGHPSPAFVAELEESVEVLRRAPKGAEFDSFREYLEADRHFHRAIFANAGNRFLDLSYGALSGQLQRFRLFSGRGVTDAEPTIAEHGAILAAIARGDSEGAAEAMRAHLTGVKQRSLAELRERA